MTTVCGRTSTHYGAGSLQV